MSSPESLWKERALMETSGGHDELRKVLDPRDTYGFKNAYIDFAQKYYLSRRLEPSSGDLVLDFGCGIGRLTEYFALRAAKVVGIDLVDAFIHHNRRNPRKLPNTDYLLMSEISELRHYAFTKVFCVGVLMFLERDVDAAETLRHFISLVPKGCRFYFLEQTHSASRSELIDGEFYCRYRTLDDYGRLFAEAGLEVTRVEVLPTRTRGPVICSVSRLRTAQRWFPWRNSSFTSACFHTDRFITAVPGARWVLRNPLPEDTLFEAQPSKRS